MSAIAASAWRTSGLHVQHENSQVLRIRIQTLTAQSAELTEVVLPHIISSRCLCDGREVIILRGIIASMHGSCYGGRVGGRDDIARAFISPQRPYAWEGTPNTLHLSSKQSRVTVAFSVAMSTPPACALTGSTPATTATPTQSDLPWASADATVGRNHALNLLPRTCAFWTRLSLAVGIRSAKLAGPLSADVSLGAYIRLS